eukprot:7010460-Lingulodinium_polyedra.AAC.1
MHHCVPSSLTMLWLPSLRAAQNSFAVLRPCFCKEALFSTVASGAAVQVLAQRGGPAQSKWRPHVPRYSSCMLSKTCRQLVRVRAFRSACQKEWKASCVCDPLAVPGRVPKTP